MPTKALNTTSVMKVVQIVTADGKKDSINIQPVGRVDLPPGSVVSEAYKKAHPEVKLIEY